jgi:hypothetical protein
VSVTDDYVTLMRQVSRESAKESQRMFAIVVRAHRTRTRTRIKAVLERYLSYEEAEERLSFWETRADWQRGMEVSIVRHKEV